MRLFKIRLTVRNSLDSGIQQLAEDRVEQCHVLLMHAAEILLKSIVIEYMALGMSRWAARNPHQYRQMAARDVRPDLSAWSDALDQGFRNVFREIDVVFPFSERTRFVVRHLYQSRNRLIHEGYDKDFTKDHVREVVTGVLPMLDEIASIIGIELTDLLDPAICRELIVGGRVLTQDSEADGYAAMLSFRAAYFYQNWRSDDDRIELPESLIRDAVQDGDGDEDTTGRYLRRPFLLSPADDTGHATCRICNHPCYLEFEPRIYRDRQGEFALPLGVLCGRCGLFIDNKQTLLAKIHYGRLNESTIGAAAWTQVVALIKKQNPEGTN
jgi:hypothetical protein